MAQGRGSDECTGSPDKREKRHRKIGKSIHIVRLEAKHIQQQARRGELQKAQRQRRKQWRDLATEGLSPEGRRMEVVKRVEERAASYEYLRKCREEPQIQVALDCSFDDMMTLKETESLARQMSFVQSFMKRTAISPSVGLTACAVTDKMAAVIFKFGGASWFMRTTSEDVECAFSDRQLVLLSPDAPVPLETVDHSAVYVICGLVDRQVSKNQSLSYASSRGFPVRRLPIAEHVPETRKCVLNVNTVFEVMVTYARSGDWNTALRMRLSLRSCQSAGRQARRRYAASRRREQYAAENEEYRLALQKASQPMPCRLAEILSEGVCWWGEIDP
ncbi:MAG: hypothetical protein KVP17_001567 [Porospora cf. gigantea B]|uniref:uncharacterized protein n=1 Tax=Porospora cf. gigantea B TaxID=2853592 RepID=UPI003571B095|nr:MAG: hypothetical protein KVP17_001567 [Porospora cf. gigantea B]